MAPGDHSHLGERSVDVERVRREKECGLSAVPTTGFVTRAPHPLFFLAPFRRVSESPPRENRDSSRLPAVQPRSGEKIRCSFSQHQTDAPYDSHDSHDRHQCPTSPPITGWDLKRPRTRPPRYSYKTHHQVFDTIWPDTSLMRGVGRRGGSRFVQFVAAKFRCDGWSLLSLASRRCFAETDRRTRRR